MIDFIKQILRALLPLLPFVILALLNIKANLKKKNRSQQFFMPLLALIYCVLILIFLGKINNAVLGLFKKLPELLNDLQTKLSAIPFLGALAGKLSDSLRKIIEEANPVYILFYIENALFLLVHILLKRLLILPLLKLLCRPGKALYEKVAGIFYEHNESDDFEEWYIKRNYGQARSLLATAYIAGIGVSVLVFLVSRKLFSSGALTAILFPAFGLIILGEIYFFLNGLTRKEMELEFEMPEADRVSNVDFRGMRDALRRLFGDKLAAEDTVVSMESERVVSNDEMLSALEQSDVPTLEVYGKFMRKKTQEGLVIDQNYLNTGCDLLSGKSILYNCPFYYDLIPYLFYPMNHALLQHHKVLVVLGRHDIADDIGNWLREGMTAINNFPDLWNMGVLTREDQHLDVGILTRSDVHDLKLHEANAEFFSEVSFVVLIEPSKLVTTAQVGLNSIVRHCRMGEDRLTYCSVDKNCDGLVDALSHILMTNLTEVSATNHAEGISSYMCWSPDKELLQHRLLPNISRYLGVGTELSFAGLKNRAEKAEWYGGDVFPVTDMHWIARQYYYDLLQYAERPTLQEGMDEYFRTSHNLWDARAEKDRYMVVEDESCNMFEIRRTFSTRAKGQGFVNVISSEYLLRDYMAENSGIFRTDPKAIPYIVADYAHTVRNVVLRLCLRMTVSFVSESDLRSELMLIDLDAEHPVESLWHALCTSYHSDRIPMNEEGKECLELPNGVRFTSELIQQSRKYSISIGKVERRFQIRDKRFIEAVVADLQNASYVYEDEQGERRYLGTELRGQVFQKYLPGQFFTLGGKYYEMLRATFDGRIVLRRAADHITGRPTYRQVREYTIENCRDSETMGDRLEIAGMKIIRQYADIQVQTPAFWNLPAYNDFKNGKLVTINGVPVRSYRNKQLLRIELPEALSPTLEVYRTLTQLINELFRTLFAENQGFICAVTSVESDLPLTYHLHCDSESPCIYIIEDSQFDIGLLETVHRNVNRILEILCDYLAWNEEAIEKSLHPPVEPEPPDFTVKPGEGDAEEKPKKRCKLGEFFCKIIEWCKKLFGKFFRRKRKKPHDADQPEPQPGEGAENGQIPDVPDPSQTAEGGKFQTADTEATDEPGMEPGEPTAEAEAWIAQPEEPTAETEEPAEEPAEAVESALAEETPSEAANPVTAEDSFKPLLNMGPRRRILFNSDPVDPLVSGSETDSVSEDDLTASSEAEDAPVEISNVDGDQVEFESEQVSRPMTALERKPYHQRYYLLYGGSDVPQTLDLRQTLEFLKAMGFEFSALRQARDNHGIAEMIEKSFDPNRKGAHYCDFCGSELVGTEYERLKDGRERCLSCGKTSVKTAKEFNKLYKQVRDNLESFYRARINVPIRVQMVNAKKLHRKLNQRFVPTGAPDGRVLGVAIKTGNSYQILVENGSPRLQSTMTMAHEMTHIWQYLNWDSKQILQLYGQAQNLEIYEGMAKWSEIQYAYLVGETATAKREEIITRARDDEYGHGFLKYQERYPLNETTSLQRGETPFTDKDRPL